MPCLTRGVSDSRLVLQDWCPSTPPNNKTHKAVPHTEEKPLAEQPPFMFTAPPGFKGNPVHEGIHLLKAKRKEMETIEQLLDCVQEFEKMKISHKELEEKNGTLTKEMDTLKQELAKQNDLTEKVKLENHDLRKQNKSLCEKNKVLSRATKDLQKTIDSLDAKLKDLHVPQAFHPKGLETITWTHCNGHNHYSDCNCGWGKTTSFREEYKCCKGHKDRKGCARQCKVCKTML